MITMTNFYVMTGIPGSGKTTLAKRLAEQHNAIVHSYDDMLGANTKHSMGGEVKKLWIEKMRSDLLTGRSVFCDGLPLTVAERKELLAQFADIPCKKVLIVKIVPLEICLQRNQERHKRLPDFVVEQAARKLEPPAKDEGWDKIYMYSE